MATDTTALKARLGEVRSKIERAKRKMEQSEAYFQQMLQEHERSMKKQRAELEALEEEEHTIVGRLQSNEAALVGAQQGQQGAAPEHTNGWAGNRPTLPNSRSTSQGPGSLQQASPAGTAGAEHAPAAAAALGRPAGAQHDGAGALPAGSLAAPGPGHRAPMLAQFAALLPGLQPSPAQQGQQAQQATPQQAPSEQPAPMRSVLSPVAVDFNPGGPAPTAAQLAPAHAAHSSRPAAAQPDLLAAGLAAKEFVPRAVQLTQQQAGSPSPKPVRRPPPGFEQQAQQGGAQAGGMAEAEAGLHPPPGFEAPAAAAQHGSSAGQQNGAGQAARGAPPGFEGKVAVQLGQSIGQQNGEGTAPRGPPPGFGAPAAVKQEAAVGPIVGVGQRDAGESLETQGAPPTGLLPASTWASIAKGRSSASGSRSASALGSVGGEIPAALQAAAAAELESLAGAAPTAAAAAAAAGGGGGSEEACAAAVAGAGATEPASANEGRGTAAGQQTAGGEMLGDAAPLAAVKGSGGSIGRGQQADGGWGGAQSRRNGPGIRPRKRLDLEGNLSQQQQQQQQQQQPRAPILAAVGVQGPLPEPPEGAAASLSKGAGGAGWAQAAAAAPGARSAEQQAQGAAGVPGAAASDEYADLLEGFYAPPEPPPPEWASGEHSREEQFPSLGPAPAPAGPQSKGAGVGGAWGSKWGSGGLRDRLLKQAQAPAISKPQPGAAPGASVEEMEIKCGLRVHGDATPDLQKRRQVRRSTFTHVEMVGKRPVNVAEGLELHERILTPEEQMQLADIVDHWVGLGRAGLMRGRTFSAPKKWLPGKGRMTVQFGACYNYATDDQGREPGIVHEEIVEPMPPVLRALCRRLTRWGVLPRASEPDSAIVNIYEEGDAIPPHIDHFDFLRPFCTLSLVSEQPIMFAQRLVPSAPGEFTSPTGEPALIPLPTGSCLVLKGWGGEKAMHCVPQVKSRRISVTLRPIAPEHKAKIQKEIQRYEATYGPLKPFWVSDAPSQPRAGGHITIK